MSNTSRKCEVTAYVKNNSDLMLTPSTVSEATGISYPTTLTHINTLQKEGKIKEKKFGGMRLVSWSNGTN